MRRKVLILLNTSCLLIAFTILLLWMISYWRVFELRRYEMLIEGAMNAGYERSRFIGSSQGGFYVGTIYLKFDSTWDIEPGFTLKYQIRTNAETEESYYYPPLQIEMEVHGWLVPVHPDWRYAGFRWHAEDTNAGRLTYLVIPNYVLVALLGFLPAGYFFQRIRAHRRRRAGRCEKCGYDLRGSPEVCPECGTSTAAHGTANGVTSSQEMKG